MGLTQCVLSPAQRSAAGYLLQAANAAGVLLLRGASGMGRTTILHELQTVLGGTVVGARELMSSLMTRQHPGIEEALLDLVRATLANNDVLYVDDLQLIKSVTDSLDYPRTGLIDLVLTVILDEAARQNKKLVFAADSDDTTWLLRRRAVTHEIGQFKVEDYLAICSAYLTVEQIAALSFDEIHRFAPVLNAHQLRNTCLWLTSQSQIATAKFIEYLEKQDLASNVNIDEVAPVNWKDLKGIDNVIEALECKIALPFENHALAAELHLKPKRGVLLAGPPGTGKTTIGRALAHRLKGKFFLIDGTMVAGTRNFYEQVHGVFEAAKRNAPSVIFIDDMDVIFESKNEPGLYRYLLTMLDGLESASADRVCVMMTAMDATMLPQPLLRSGRLELWLETRLPDAAARTEIILDKLRVLPPPISSVDIEMVVDLSKGLTGADLRAVIEDAKLLYATDKAAHRPIRPIEDYFLDAIETVRENRRTYARKKPAQLIETVKMGFSVV